MRRKALFLYRKRKGQVQEDESSPHSYQEDSKAQEKSSPGRNPLRGRCREDPQTTFAVRLIISYSGDKECQER